MNLKVLKAVRLFLALAIVACFTSCTVASTSRPESNGEGILGRSAVANADNSRIRCDYETLEPNHYKVTCYVVVFDAIGELLATSYAANLTARWSALAQIAGPGAEIACSVATNLLSSVCDVRTPNSVPTSYVANLLLTDTQSGAAENLLAQVTLPFTADNFGIIPSLPELESRPESSTESSSEMAVGLQTKALPDADLPLSFSSGRVIGEKVYLNNNQSVFSFDLAKKALRVWANFTSMSFITQMASPRAPLNSNRLRLSRDGFSLLTVTDTHEVVILQSDLWGQRFTLIPEEGKPRVLHAFTDPQAVGRHVDLRAMRYLADGRLIVATNSKVISVSKEGVIGTLAGYGPNPPTGHVETTQASSLVLNLSGFEVFPDGALLLRDFERVIYVAANGTSQVLFSKGSSTYWNSSIAVSNTGLAFILLNNEDLYQFEGAVQRSVVNVRNPGGSYPAVGEKVAIANFSLSCESPALGGVNSRGPFFLSKCGIAQYSLGEGVVESLFTVKRTMPNSVVGAQARNAYYAPMSDLVYLSDGRLTGVAGTNLVTVSPADNTVTSVPLVGVTSNPQARPLYYLVASPTQKFLVGWPLAKLFRLSDEGVLTELHTLGTGVVQVAFATDTTGFARVGNNLLSFTINPDDSVTTSVLSTAFPTELKSARSYAMSVAADGALLAMGTNALGRFDAGTGSFQILMGAGASPPTEGGFAHDMHFEASSNDRRMQAVGDGIVYSDDVTVNYLKRVGTREDGSPLLTHHRLYPSASANPDCAGNLAARVSSATSEGLQATLDSMCPCPIAALAGRAVAGVAQIATARSCTDFGSILVIGMPLF